MRPYDTINSNQFSRTRELPCTVGEWTSIHIDNLTSVVLLGIGKNKLADGFADFLVGAGAHEGVFVPKGDSPTKNLDVSQAKFLAFPGDPRIHRISSAHWCTCAGPRHLHSKLDATETDAAQ
jgi:hypothetical protein